MVQVIERVGGRHADVWEIGFGGVRGGRSLERVVLRCNCRAKLVLGGHVLVHCVRLDGLECGICGERFVLSG